MTPKLLTVEDVAERLTLTASTIYRLVAIGDLPAIRVTLGAGATRRTRGPLRFTEADVDDWLRRHRTPAKATLKPSSVARASVRDLPGSERYLS